MHPAVPGAIKPSIRANHQAITGAPLRWKILSGWPGPSTESLERSTDTFNAVSYTHLTLPTICSV
eukprot:709663-Rhodomonas_salina.3